MGFGAFGVLVVLVLFGVFGFVAFEVFLCVFFFWGGRLLLVLRMLWVTGVFVCFGV